MDREPGSRPVCTDISRAFGTPCQSCDMVQTTSCAGFIPTDVDPADERSIGSSCFSPTRPHSQRSDFILPSSATELRRKSYIISLQPNASSEYTLIHASSTILKTRSPLCSSTRGTEQSCEKSRCCPGTPRAISPSHHAQTQRIQHLKTVRTSHSRATCAAGPWTGAPAGRREEPGRTGRAGGTRSTRIGLRGAGGGADIQGCSVAIGAARGDIATRESRGLELRIEHEAPEETGQSRESRKGRVKKILPHATNRALFPVLVVV